MFCVVYRFIVKNGKEEQFVASWLDVTRQIYELCGSLGSRLHKVHSGASSMEFIACAQWPSREDWENYSLPESADSSALDLMRDCCKTMETVYEMDRISDYLKKEPYKDQHQGSE